jgi:hypothetical protein
VIKECYKNLTWPEYGVIFLGTQMGRVLNQVEVLEGVELMNGLENLKVNSTIKRRKCYER